jgi:hypothetical protein
MVSVPLGTIGLASLTLGVLHGHKWGWSSPEIIACFISAVVFLTYVVLRSRQHAEPLIDLSLFQHRRFTSASIATFAFNLPVAGFWFSAPLFMQTVWNWSVLKSGCSIMPTPVVIFLTATISGRYSDRGWMKRIISSGMLLSGLGLFGLFVFLDENVRYFTHYFPFAVLYGIGLGLAWSTLTGAALMGIDHEKFGIANGTNLTFRQMGGAMGVAMVIAVSGAAGVAGSAAAFQRVWLALAVWVAVTLAFFSFAYPKDH